MAKLRYSRQSKLQSNRVIDHSGYKAYLAYKSTTDKPTDEQKKYCAFLVMTCREHGIDPVKHSNSRNGYDYAIKRMKAKLKEAGIDIGINMKPRYTFDKKTGKVINMWTGIPKEEE